MGVRSSTYRVAVLALALGAASCGRPAGQPDAGAPTAASVQDQLDPCKAEEGSFARSLCDNAAVKAATDEMSATIAQAAGTVTPEGQTLFVQGQEQWLAAARVQCGITEAGAGPANLEQANCLQSLLRTRSESARASVEVKGPFRFQAVEDIKATPSAEIAGIASLGDAAPAAITRNIRYPRIDEPRNEVTERFNAAVRQSPQYELADGIEETVTYEIVYASSEVVSVRFNLRSESPLTGRPDVDMKAVSIDMRSGQPLGVADVFRPGSGWERFLFRRALAGLRPLARQRIAGVDPEPASVEDTVKKPQTWLVTERGLTILFSPLNAGLPEGDAYLVTIPWAELRPYLNPNAPAPIRPAR